ncbi:DUF3048 domain-containing protein [Candidatus Saccharibacteria bacterium]|nr:DUF3048 domain-containing protein [Candidatus Saccharibacteria bacterium]
MLKLKTPKFFGIIGAWVHQHHTATYAIAAVIVLLTTAGVSAVLFYKKPVEISQQPTTAVKKTPPAPVKYYSPLTGVQVADEAAAKQAATAIMIENSPDARPQSGIKAAGVVFEAIAEGGITRFLALYQQEKPGLVGPVRSVRLYYVDWLAPFQASVAHVGGSKFALDEVRNGQYRDIDQFFNAGTYWRAKDRYAPHNVYTNFANLDALNKAKGYNESAVAGFDRKDPAPASPPTATQLNISISGPLYNSSYTYDAASNTYLRSQAGKPHTDRESGQIAPTVVVAMFVNMSRVMEDGYREQITTTGSGRAVIFQDGTALETTWHKASRTGQINFTDAAGKPVKLNRGQTWISAVPNGTGNATWK